MSDKTTPSMLSRTEIAQLIAARTELPAGQIEGVVKEFEAIIAQQLKAKGEVRLLGFGTFKTADRSAREGRNPKTGEPLTIAARSVVQFVPAKALKELGR
ncbi:MAG TPA: HU family DNA-binding protein [Abditibacterium sp.]|jgi:DNA-binding protein HU-beta